MRKARKDLVFKVRWYLILIWNIILFPCCAHVESRLMEVTAYCGCGKCCGWSRGNWKYFKLNLWHRYYSSGPNKGERYRGRTASGNKPRQYHPGLISADSFSHPWKIPFRLVFPWRILPHPGTIAADTEFYPFGTIMFVEGYGKGVVEDRGSAIKGPERIDVFYKSHRRALGWGRRKVPVKIKVKRHD